MKIYIAAPLFSDAEKEFNLNVDEYLIGMGFDTFLPQRDGFLMAELLKDHTKEEAKRIIFEKDVEEIKQSDILVFILDGRIPDEGACVEIGIGYTLGKECIGLKTDVRSLIEGEDNPLIEGALNWRIASNLKELGNMLLKIKK